MSLSAWRCKSRCLQVICDDNFHKGFNRIYDISLALSLRRLFIKYSDQFRNLGGEWNTELAAKCWSIRDFDDGITRVCFGWPSVDAYYEGQQTPSKSLLVWSSNIQKSLSMLGTGEEIRVPFRLSRHTGEVIQDKARHVKCAVLGCFTMSTLNGFGCCQSYSRG